MQFEVGGGVKMCRTEAYLVTYQHHPAKQRKDAVGSSNGEQQHEVVSPSIKQEDLEQHGDSNDAKALTGTGTLNPSQ